MKLSAAIANNLWLASSLPEWLRFKHSTSNVEATQRVLLDRYLRANAATAFGREHDFANITCWEEYADRVPVRPYDELGSWITRIAAGEQNVLTADPVRLFEPSGGSSGAEKWIPYTDSLQAEFRRAVAAWIADLFLEMPRLMAGRAYWSLTPPTTRDRTDESAIPIGFDEDSAYLGGVAERLVNLALATPPGLHSVSDMDDFWRITASYLPECRDLRLISVWHPSYLLLLLRHIRDSRSGSLGTGALWPKLGLISCWGDARAEALLPELRAEFPGVKIQAKGLLATEGVVTFPFAGLRPLAIRSHFFEFQDDDGEVCPAWAVAENKAYTIIMTTGGGLYRYALRDRVEVTGFVGGAPSLRFLGKADNVSDHCGEKLGEAFVTSCLGTVFARFGLEPGFAMLALDPGDDAPGYALYVESAVSLPPELGLALDEELRRSHHYDLCIRLGQLRPVCVAQIEGNAYDAFVTALMADGVRLGDIKPVPLSRRTDWSDRFRLE